VQALERWLSCGATFDSNDPPMPTPILCCLAAASFFVTCEQTPAFDARPFVLAQTDPARLKQQQRPRGGMSEQQLLQNPMVQQILRDPEVQQQIMDDPRFEALVQDPQMQRLMQNPQLQRQLHQNQQLQQMYQLQQRRLPGVPAGDDDD
jgi:hypothetical protein